MVEAPSAPRTVQFGPYEADLATGELRRDGAKVPLQDKPFQMLMLLLQRPGTLVTREDLRSELWPADTFVDFEHGLNTAVRKLRQALDDSADTPRFVETLPRRGYRFVGEVVGAPSLEPAPALAPPPVPSPPAPATTSAHQPARWRVHAAWAALVLLAFVLLRVDRGGESTLPETPPNPRPVIVLMDSPLPGRVYDARTAAAGGTNADDITDALQDLPVSIQKENTSPMWHREDQVVRQNPDLIVSHLSCLLDQRLAAAEGDRALFDHLSTVAFNRLVGVYGYLGAANRRTRFLVYSRSAFATEARAASFVADAEARFPTLRGRLHTLHVPGGRDNASFRDPGTARLIRDRVKAILGLS